MASAAKPTSLTPIEQQGWLKKKGLKGPTKSFKARFCVLTKSFLYYFKNETVCIVCRLAAALGSLILRNNVHVHEPVSSVPRTRAPPQSCACA